MILKINSKTNKKKLNKQIQKINNNNQISIHKQWLYADSSDYKTNQLMKKLSKN